jgi:GxxExxY protein
MNADLMKNESEVLLHADLTQKIIGVFFDVYNELGPGFLEAVYRNALCIALRKEGLSVEPEAPVNVMFRGEVVGEYRADILVNEVVVLELKTARAIDRIHQAQLMNYLRATKIEIGLLLNFGDKPEFKRLACSNTRKPVLPILSNFSRN